MIQCVETGKIYKNVRDARIDMNLKSDEIKRALIKPTNSTHHTHWREVEMVEGFEKVNLKRVRAKKIRYGAEYYDKHYYPLAKNCNYRLYDIVGGKYQVFFKSCGLRYIHVEVCVLPIFGDKRKTFFFTYDIFNKRFTTNVSDDPMALTYVPNLYTAICNCVSSLM